MCIKRASAAVSLCLFLIVLSGAVCFANPQAINPCAIITRSEAEEIMGEQMRDGTVREQKATGMKLCLYEAADDNSFAMLQVSIEQGERAGETFAIIKENFPDHEAIEGTGDDAFIATPGMHILKDDCYLTIAAGNLNRNRDKVLAAGKKAVANLAVAVR